MLFWHAAARSRWRGANDTASRDDLSPHGRGLSFGEHRAIGQRRPAAIATMTRKDETAGRLMFPMRRFTPDEIARLRHMAGGAFPGTAIARALDRTPQAIRVKCVELGIRLRPEKSKDRLRIVID